MLHKGEGAAADRPRALRLMQQAANQDMAAAQMALGRFHERGEGVATDPVLALQWYQRASDTARKQPARFDNARVAAQATAARDRLARQIAQQPGN